MNSLIEMLPIPLVELYLSLHFKMNSSFNHVTLTIYAAGHSALKFNNRSNNKQTLEIAICVDGYDQFNCVISVTASYADMCISLKVRQFLVSFYNNNNMIIHILYTLVR